MGKILDIVINPNKILRQKSINVKEHKVLDDELQDFVQDMTVTMLQKDGVGLAAPQVGKNIRIIVINNDDEIFAMINPKLTKKSWAKVWDDEGCLSVPKTYGKVPRHKKVDCMYIDVQGKKRKIQAQDMFARIIQHEIDHLDGILFIDKAKDIKKVED